MQTLEIGADTKSCRDISRLFKDYLVSDVCRCMLELKFSIYHRTTVCPHRLPMQYWLNNDILLLSDWCACVHVKEKMVSQRKPYFFSERFELPRVTSNLEKSDGLVHCSVKNAAVLCKNHCERVMQI